MRKILPVLVVFCLVFFFTGCIRSRVIVTSQPSGADITMNGVYRGQTPITIPFGWYWFYDFEVEKEGFQKLESRERFKAPVWFYIPFDLFLEAMPFRIYDTKRLNYSLVPSEVPDLEEKEEVGQ